MSSAPITSTVPGSSVGVPGATTSIPGASTSVPGTASAGSLAGTTSSPGSTTTLSSGTGLSGSSLSYTWYERTRFIQHDGKCNQRVYWNDVER